MSNRRNGYFYTMKGGNTMLLKVVVVAVIVVAVIAVALYIKKK